MGRTMQKRLVRKRDLEKAISEIEPYLAPKAYLEQYTVPSEVAADILFIATYVYPDIIGKTVIDLGCGTGRLAIGATILGARETFGVDLDIEAVKVARKNMKKDVNKKIHWIVADIEVIHGIFDTVIQNPPFGVKRRSADRKFLKKSLELGRIVYSLHKSGAPNREFIKRFIQKHGGKITGIFPMNLDIPKMFEFHKKKRYTLQVDLYRIETRRT